MKKALNIRYLVQLLVIVAIVAGGIHLLHGRQAGKQAEAFLHQADAAEQLGDVDRYATYLRRLLVLQPNNTDARARLGVVLDDNAQSARDQGQAFYELEQVLRETPSRSDLRRRSVALALQLKLYPEAKAHIGILLNEFPNDGTVHEFDGQCRAVTGDEEGAAAAFAKAVELKPDLIKAYASLAFLYQQPELKRPKKDADDVIKSMLQKNSDSAAAHLTAAGYYKSVGDTDGVAKQVIEARRCDPDDMEVILAVAALTRAQADNPGRASPDNRIDLQEARKKSLEDACTLLHQGIEKRLPEIAAPVLTAERAQWTRKKKLVAAMFEELVALEMALNRLPDALKSAKRGVESLPDASQLRLQLVEVLILQKEWTEAEKQLADLKNLSDLSAVVSYQRARIYAGQEMWPEARNELLANAVGSTSSVAMEQKVQFLLGQCYDRMGLVDQRLEAFRLALPKDPGDELWFPVSMSIAASLADMGRPMEAVGIYEKVAVRYSNAFIPLARLLFAQTMKQPADQRDWSAVENRLKSAPEALEREILLADLRYAQKKPDEARKILDDARTKYPKAVEPWTALAALEWLEKKPDVAAATLAEAKGKLGDRAAIRLVRARWIPTGKPVEAAKEIDRLAENCDSFEAGERRRLLLGLAQIAQVSATRESANRFWSKLAKESKNNLGLQLIVFDNAMQANDEASMKNALAEITKTDGQGRSARLTQAHFWIWKARQEPQPNGPSYLKEASVILDQLERENVGSANIPLAQGIVLDMQKDPKRAIVKYRQAYDLGERGPSIIRRLIQLNLQQREYAEARKLFNRLPKGEEAAAGFEKEAIVLSLQSHNADRALELAAKLVPAETKDYDQQIWLSRIQWMAGKSNEAKATLKRATEIAPDKPDAWVVLVQYAAALNGKADAEKIIEEAKSKISKSDVSLAMAQCYETLGQFDQAWSFDEQALKERPNELSVLKSAASLQMRRNKFPEALGLFESIVANDKATVDDVRDANRIVAIIQSLQPDFQARRRYLIKIGVMDAQGSLKPLAGTETPDEIRSRAVILALQGDLRSRREAIKILEESETRQKLPDDEQFLLAQLHNSVGDWFKARLILARLVKTEDPADEPKAQYVAYYANGLIRQPDLEEAEKRVKQLEERADQRDAPGTIALRARLWAAAGESAKARVYLLGCVTKPDAPINTIASLLEEIGSGDDAEPLYAGLVAKAKRPEAVLSLAAYYSRQNRVDQALNICEQAWKTANPEAVAGTCVAVLYSARNPRPEQIGLAIARLKEQLDKNPASVALLESMAALKNLEGDYGSAISFYRRLVARDSQDALAQNNLAFLLSAHERKHDEALQIIERAKANFGPIPTLLDTEAVIYTAKKEPETAVKLLNEVIAQKPTGSGYFHLALAYQAAQKPADAREAWRSAQKLKLKLTDLHALERGDYTKLSSKMTGP